MSKKGPPPEQMSLFDDPGMVPPKEKPAAWDPKRPDYRPLWEPRPPQPPQPASPRDQPTAPDYDVERAPLAQKHSRTSVEAANMMSGSRAGSLRATIWRWLLEQPDGATDEEGQDALGMDGNTYRPRRVELQEAGLVVATTLERRTHSNRWAAVWRGVRPEGA